MEEAVTKVIDTLTQEDFHGALQKLLERYNKCIGAGGDYFEGDNSFMCVLSIKVPIRKMPGNLSYVPRMWNILTKDGKYCSYLKCICSGKDIYYKSPDEYLGNYPIYHPLRLGRIWHKVNFLGGG